MKNMVITDMKTMDTADIAAGAMTTGWQKIGGSWYYMNSSGAMLTGWQFINNKWYYLSGSGVMVTGWYKVGAKWYTFDESGVWLDSKLADGIYMSSLDPFLLCQAPN